MNPFSSAVSVKDLPPKPRAQGVTSLLDKGLGPTATRDLVATAGQWIDVVKLGWGTSRVCDGDVLREKIALFHAAQIKVCLGGTFLEVALAQGRVDAYLEAAKSVGIRMVEVSNGVHPMSDSEKLDLIRKVRAAGFGAWSEVGKKLEEEDERLGIDDRVRCVEQELEAGAEKVILEARESGTIGIYSKDGKPAVELIDVLSRRFGLHQLVFEAPQKAQQVWMIRRFGPEVNLGNVPPDDAISLATLRTGLRGDTFPDFHLKGVDVYLDLGVNGALEARKRGGIVVVIDALRFSSTIVAVLGAGMASVKVVAAAEDCIGEVTAGERGGKKLANVRHNNSPTELLREKYQGKKLVLTSSNGAEVMLSAAGPGNTILIGALVNAKAVAEAAMKLAEEKKEPITLLRAGRNGVACIEDSLAASEIVSHIRGGRLHGAFALPNFAAHQAEFFTSDAAKNLMALGYGDDVGFCSQRNMYDVVPWLNEQGEVVPLRR